MAKFIMSIGENAYDILSNEAKNRDVTVQQLLRAVVVPDWIKQNSNGQPIDIMNLAIVGISLLVVRVLADEESVLKPEFGKGLFGPPQLARPLSSRHQSISDILPWL